MEFTKVELSNLFCFGKDQVITFDAPVYQVIGEITGLENQSNGVGKSSIFYAIQEILFGKNLKDTLKKFTGNIFTNPESYSGAVYFTHFGHQYIVKVVRSGSKVKVEFIKDGEDISAHTVPDTYKLIKEELQIDYDIFTMLCYLSPTVSTPNILFFGTPKEKKLMFTKLFGLQGIVDTVDRVADDVKSQNQSLQDLARAHDRVKPVIIPEPLDKPDEIRILSHKQTIERYQKEIIEMAVTISDYNYWEGRSAKLLDLSNKLKKYPHAPLPDKTKSEVRVLSEELQKCKERLAVRKAKQKELENVDKVCPVCGKEIDNAEHIATELALINTQVEAFTIEVAKLQEEVREYVKQWNDADEYAKLSSEYKELENELQNRNTNIVDITQLKSRRTKLESIIGNLQNEVSKLESDRNAWLTRDAEIKTLTKIQIEKIAEKNKLTDEIAGIKSDLEIISVIPEHLGLNGFIAVQIRDRAARLATQFNNYLSVFSDNSLSIKLDNKSDKLNFILYRNGRELPVNNLSAGQLTMLQLASILALRELVLESKGIYIDLLVLDELFGTLDSIRRSILIDTLRDFSVAKQNKILSISHLYFDSTLPTITVKQEDGVSKINQ